MNDTGSRSSTADWILATRSIAREADCEAVVAPLLARLAHVQRTATEILVTGATNAGKSTLINRLLGSSALPVGSLPSEAEFVVHGEPAATAATATAGPAAAGQPVRVSVDCPWLRARSLRLVEKQALDVSEDQLSQAIAACVNEADVMILVIDALMPVRRPEIALLDGCERRQVPTIVALAKIDQLATDDRAAVLGYVENQVRTCAPGARFLGAGGDDMAQQLREAIDAIVEHTDFPVVRDRQTRDMLLGILGIVAGAATTGLEAQRASDSERASALRQRRHDIESQSIRWAELERQLDARRAQIDDQLRKHLAANQQAIEELLLFDLEKQSDVKTWWQRELPFRLHRELKNLAGQMSGSVNRQIHADLRWLQDEMVRQFKLPAPPLDLDASVTIEAHALPQNDLPLQDMHRLRLLSRLGNMASVVIAGRLLLSAGWSGVTLGVGVLAGLAADQLAGYTASRDRSKVRAPLTALIARASLEFGMDISSKLRVGYHEIVEALQRHQRSWLEAQTRSLLSIAERRGDAPSWQPILERTRDLAAAISGRPQTAAAVDATHREASR
jgi:GTP-binding protein EngB required for normal cell division